MFSSFPIWKLLKHESIKCWQNFSNGNVYVGAFTIKWRTVSRKVEILLDMYDSRGFQIFLFQHTPRNNIFISQPSASIMYVLHFKICALHILCLHTYITETKFHKSVSQISFDPCNTDHLIVVFCTTQWKFWTESLKYTDHKPVNWHHESLIGCNPQFEQF